MSAQTHHILIFDSDDTLILAGAHLKQKKHPEARILKPADVKAGQPIFNQNDPTPWKLHIFEHGHEGMKIFGGLNMAQVAELIRNCGLLEQPNQSSDATRPVVRLDVCEAGLGVTSTVKQLATALDAQIKKAPSLVGKTRVFLWGGKGNVIAPWDEKRKGRMIGNPAKETEMMQKWTDAMADYKTKFGIDFKAKLKDPVDLMADLYLSGKTKLYPKVFEILKVWKNRTLGNELDAKAKVAWVTYQEAMQKFHELVRADSSLTLDKAPDNNKESYLVRAEATGT